MTLDLLRRLEDRIDALVTRQQVLERDRRELRQQVAALLDERGKIADQLDRVLADLDKLDTAGDSGEA